MAGTTICLLNRSQPLKIFTPPQCLPMLADLIESDLSPDSVNRFSRQIIVPAIGIAGQKRLESCRILVVGTGGLGSPVLSYLAMAGIGEIGIADFDTVEIHNLQRQSIHSEEWIGRLKVDSAESFIRRINSNVLTRKYPVRMTDDNCPGIISGYDMVLDCTDEIGIRYALNDWCRRLGREFICASVLRWEGQVFVVPRGGSCFRCIFPRPKERAASCDQSGVVGSLCGVIGAMQATEAIKLIVGGKTADRGGSEESDIRSTVIIYNGLVGRHSQYQRRWKKCQVCRSVAAGGVAGGSVGLSDGTTCGVEVCGTPQCGIEGHPLADGCEYSMDWTCILKCPERLVLVDIRSAEHYGMYRVCGFRNIPDPLDMTEQLRQLAKPVVICCYRGVSSRKAVSRLRGAGVTAYSAEGGIEEFKRMVEREHTQS